ncbi:hypothetical protein EYR40_009255 [Pleurotus pulmonarius]|nr:hypothetical protein EYR36_005373 [Pleurotus pulmonarius]KAF4590351.1 hypothetical protein EYR38_009650 [Pleurotus pulmonarius]KAF4590659.1 hypothetical protein EYR40_009255 [Pleurotus pulmonarius]
MDTSDTYGAEPPFDVEECLGMLSAFQGVTPSNQGSIPGAYASPTQTWDQGLIEELRALFDDRDDLRWHPNGPTSSQEGSTVIDESDKLWKNDVFGPPHGTETVEGNDQTLSDIISNSFGGADVSYGRGNSVSELYPRRSQPSPGPRLGDPTSELGYYQQEAVSTHRYQSKQKLKSLKQPSSYNRSQAIEGQHPFGEHTLCQLGGTSSTFKDVLNKVPTTCSNNQNGSGSSDPRVNAPKTKKQRDAERNKKTHEAKQDMKKLFPKAPTLLKAVEAALLVCKYMVSTGSVPRDADNVEGLAQLFKPRKATTSTFAEPKDGNDDKEAQQKKKKKIADKARNGAVRELTKEFRGLFNRATTNLDALGVGEYEMLLGQVHQPNKCSP